MDELLDPTEVAARYDVSVNRGRQLVRAWWRRPGPDFPRVIQKSRRSYVQLAELEAWETRMRDLGRPLPGERRRGPRPNTHRA